MCATSSQHLHRQTEYSSNMQPTITKALGIPFVHALSWAQGWAPQGVQSIERQARTEHTVPTLCHHPQCHHPQRHHPQCHHLRFYGLIPTHVHVLVRKKGAHFCYHGLLNTQRPTTDRWPTWRAHMCATVPAPTYIVPRLDLHTGVCGINR